MPEQIALTRAQFNDFIAMRRAFFNPANSLESGPQSGVRHESDIVFLLLEDLESGQPARAAVLRADLKQQKQMLTVYGLRDADAEFQIEWDSETITGISIYATPDELKQRLIEFTFVESKSISVQFGNHVRPIGEDVEEFQVFRWIVKLSRSLSVAEQIKAIALGNSPEVPLMEPTIVTGNQTWLGSEFTEWEDSGRTIYVRSALPVGVDLDNNTPMQAGAIGVATWVESAGWVVHAIEARHITGDFIQEPYY